MLLRMASFLGISLMVFGYIISPVAYAAEKPNYSAICIKSYDCSFYDPDFETSSGECGSSTTLSGNSNGEKVFNYFIDKGLDNLHAAALAGNIQQESNFDPKADNGRAITVSFNGEVEGGLSFKNYRTTSTLRCSLILLGGN